MSLKNYFGLRNDISAPDADAFTLLAQALRQDRRSLYAEALHPSLQGIVFRMFSPLSELPAPSVRPFLELTRVAKPRQDTAVETSVRFIDSYYNPIGGPSHQADRRWEPEQLAAAMTASADYLGYYNCATAPARYWAGVSLALLGQTETATQQMRLAFCNNDMRRRILKNLEDHQKSAGQLPTSLASIPQVHEVMEKAQLSFDTVAA